MKSTLYEKNEGFETHGGVMVRSEMDMKSWKLEQIRYYRDYLSAFEPETKEYSIITNGIAAIEKTLR